MEWQHSDSVGRVGAGTFEDPIRPDLPDGASFCVDEETDDGYLVRWNPPAVP